MPDNRYINVGSGGTYNENSQNHNVQGDFIQIQGNFVQSSQIDDETLNQTIVDIQQLLEQLQTRYSPVEAQQKAAIELASKARRDPVFKQVLAKLRFVAANGGIEAVIGKIIELALKPLGM